MDSIAITIPESINYDEYLVATYAYQTPANVRILDAVRAIAETQSCGTWVSVGKSSEVIRQRHLGRIVSLWEIPDYENSLPDGTTRRDWIFQVAYPIHNFGSQIPLMLTTAYGEVAAVEHLRLIDLHFPEAYTRQFNGARFGIQGIRELLGVQDRPLVLSIIKPPLGLTPDESAAEFYKAALGGADAVKDDELLVSHPWSKLTERIRAHQQAARAVYEETGQKTLYFTNITDRPDRLVENAHRAIEAGANALMVNFLTVGISALSMLADDLQINLPVMAHMNFAGGLYGAPQSGVSSHLLLGKLPRLAGADVVVYPSAYGKFAMQAAKSQRIGQALLSPFYNLKPVWPMPGGGIHPGLLPRLHKELGIDFVVGAGGAIYGHPLGPTHGAMAFRQAIDSTIAGQPLHQAAESALELKAALELWGAIEA